MKNLVSNIPDTVQLEDTEILMIIAAGLYERRKLSLGQAAQLAGLAKRTFMEMLGSQGVSVFNHAPSDLDRDIENAKRYHI